MRSPPEPTHLLALVAAFLKNELVPALPDALAFQTRVAANALDLVCRELAQAEPAERTERSALQSLLDTDEDDLEVLNGRLCDAIAKGRLNLQSPALRDYLRLGVQNRLAIDQPRYSAYLRSLEQWPATGHQNATTK